MTDIAIFGAGGFGRETAATLNELTYSHPEGWRFIGFFDDTLPIGTEIGGFGNILGGLDTLNNWQKPINIAVCLGYPHDRRIIIEALHNPHISYPNLIHKDFFCSDTKSLQIGQGNIIQSGCKVTTNVKIGDFNCLNGMIGFGHDVKVGDFNSFMPKAIISGRVQIGDCNLLGANCFILEKIKIGNNVNVGPLSALLNKPKSGNTYIGNPAKIFKH